MISSMSANAACLLCVVIAGEVFADGNRLPTVDHACTVAPDTLCLAISSQGVELGRQTPY